MGEKKQTEKSETIEKRKRKRQEDGSEAVGDGSDFKKKKSEGKNN